MVGNEGRRQTSGGTVKRSETPWVMDDDGPTQQTPFIPLSRACVHNMSHLMKFVANLETSVRNKHGNEIQITGDFMWAFDSQLQAALMLPPMGWCVWLPHVRFVREQISAACSFHKRRSSCLHVAICEAGVQGSFDFVSHIQTERGLHLFSQRQRHVPLGPGAYLTQVPQRQHICTQPNGQR